jgi:hypothetical protein
MSTTTRRWSAPGNTRSGRAFRLFSIGSSLTLENSLIQNNQALGGPGIDAYYRDSRPPTYVQARPGGDGSGGGLFAATGTVNLTNVPFASNTAQGSKGGDGLGTLAGGDGGNGSGGGLVVGGVVTIVHCTVESNSASGGAGGRGGSRGRGTAGAWSVEGWFIWMPSRSPISCTTTPPPVTPTSMGPTRRLERLTPWRGHETGDHLLDHPLQTAPSQGCGPSTASR